MDLRTYKNELRNHYSKRRKDIPLEVKKMLDDQISERFLNMIAYKHAKQILFYASTDDEISTDFIFLTALSNGKSCFFPKCYDQSRMDFYKVESANDLVTDSFNIKAPLKVNERYSSQPSDIIIVPAMAYDSKGFRLGYGKGFYDRFLTDFLGTKIGLCYSDFITDSLPRGRYDISVDVIVTEKRLISL